MSDELYRAVSCTKSKSHEDVETYDTSWKSEHNDIIEFVIVFNKPEAKELKKLTTQKFTFDQMSSLCEKYKKVQPKLNCEYENKRT